MICLGPFFLDFLEEVLADFGVFDRGNSLHERGIEVHKVRVSMRLLLTYHLVDNSLQHTVGLSVELLTKEWSDFSQSIQLVDLALEVLADDLVVEVRSQLLGDLLGAGEEAQRHLRQYLVHDGLA